jgi:hypothetical protein
MVCFEARSHLLVQRAADYPCKYHTQLPWHTACCLEESLVTIVNMNLVLILVNSILRSTRNREELFQWAAVWRSRVLRMCWTNSLRLSFPRIGTLCILLQTQTRYFFDIISGLPLLVRGCGRVSWREDRLCNKVWSHLYWHVHVDGELDPCSLGSSGVLSIFNNYSSDTVLVPSTAASENTNKRIRTEMLASNSKLEGNW